MSTLAVVLAAGGGSRFEGDGSKLLADLHGRPLVAWAIAHAVAAGLDDTLVVTGAAGLGRALPAGARTLANPNWAAGLATSLTVAVDDAARAGHDAIVVGLGDQPGIPPEAWRAVAASPSPLAIAVYGDRRGHPVRLHRRFWSELPTTGDEGARSILRLYPEVVGEVPCPGAPDDVDRLDDLRRLRSADLGVAPTPATDRPVAGTPTRRGGK